MVGSYSRRTRLSANSCRRLGELIPCSGADETSGGRIVRLMSTPRERRGPSERSSTAAIMRWENPEAFIREAGGREAVSCVHLPLPAPTRGGDPRCRPWWCTRPATPDVLRYEEIDRPEPGDGEVLIKVHAEVLDRVRRGDRTEARGRESRAGCSDTGRRSHRLAALFDRGVLHSGQTALVAGAAGGVGQFRRAVRQGGRRAGDRHRLHA